VNSALWEWRGGHIRGYEKILNFCLWFDQVFLFLCFGMPGVMKTMLPMAPLNLGLPWAAYLPGELVRVIGIFEFLCAVGVLLPAITGLMVKLVPVSAAGLTAMVALAVAFHVWRGELSVIQTQIVLGAMAAFVAWGRFHFLPNRSRS